MAADFLAEDNICGQNLLQLVGVGNSIIAEILRLKDYIPYIFWMKKVDGKIKYADIIFDFSYFQKSDVLEKRIETDSVSFASLLVFSVHFFLITNPS